MIEEILSSEEFKKFLIDSLSGDLVKRAVNHAGAYLISKLYPQLKEQKQVKKHYVNLFQSIASKAIKHQGFALKKIVEGKIAEFVLTYKLDEDLAREIALIAVKTAQHLKKLNFKIIID